MKQAVRSSKEANYKLSGNEIRDKIDANNMLIESLLSPSKFTLNNPVVALLKENEELQRQCDHIFEDGYCIYCYKGEGK